MLVGYGETLLALRQIRRAEDHPLSAAWDFCIVIAAFNSPHTKHHYNMLSFEFLINALAVLIRYTKMRAAAKNPSWAANRILVLECWCWHAHVMYSTSGSPPPGPDLRTLIFQARTRNAWPFSCDSLCRMDLTASTIVSYCTSAT
jgi:hypothetical protein